MLIEHKPDHHPHPPPPPPKQMYPMSPLEIKEQERGKGTPLVIGRVTAAVAATASGMQEAGQAGPGGTAAAGE